MNKLQPVSFADVQDMLDFLPPKERAMVQLLRQLVMESVQGVQEKLSFNVPFYARNRSICFIWPGSVPWGGIREGVQLGFTNARLLRDEENYLNWGTRKTVAIKVFYTLAEIHEQTDIIKAFLAEAAEVDATRIKKVKNTGKK